MTMTSDLLARLQRHYIKPGDPMPGGAFLPEVTLEGRRADALYVGFFRSRGKFLVGHELKVSRADWLHELDQPAKAETWLQHCHSWYLVVPDRSIVHDGELPHGWGLMVPNPRTKTRMDLIVKAAHKPDAQPSWEATHAIVQRMDSLRMAAMESHRLSARDAAYAEIEKQVEARVNALPQNRAEERLRAVEKLLAEVGDILGFQIVEGTRAWREDQVTVDQIRGSFGPWLAADKLTAEALGYRVDALRGVRESVEAAERGIASLREAI